MKTNFLLVGHGGFYNRGCEAIVRGTVSILHESFSNCDITLISSSAKADKDMAAVDSDLAGISIPVIEGAHKPSLAWFWQTFNRRILHPHMPFRDFLERSYYRKSDVVLSIGGDNFSDDYGGPKHCFDSLHFARAYGAKTVIWGASIGPFSPTKKEQEWAQELKKCDLITVRETSTQDYLRKLDVVDNVKIVADPAFLLPAFRPKAEFDPDFFGHGPVVGIGMSDLLSKYGTSKTEYVRVFSEFVEYLLKKYSAKILLVPHVIDTHPHRDDLSVCKDVIGALNCSGDIELLPETYNACEMKYCISKCDYFIGARTHSTIASFSTMVPTISIGYSLKAHGINHDLLGNDEYVIPHNKLSFEILKEVFGILKKNEDTIRKRLNARIPAVKEEAMKAGRYLLEKCGV